MTIAELGAIGEFIGSILTLVTLVYLAIQVRQNTRHVRAQMGHEGWLSTEAGEMTLLGDDPADTLAKASLSDEPLTDRDLVIVDAHCRALTMILGRVEHMNSQNLEIYTVEQTAQGFANQFNSAVYKTWFEVNRTYVDSFAPEIGARIAALMEDPGCLSRAESLKEFRQRYPVE